MENTPKHVDTRCNIWPLQHIIHHKDEDWNREISEDFIKSISKSEHTYHYFRKVKEDTSCFYRAFIYAYIELIIVKGSKLYQQFYRMYF